MGMDYRYAGSASYPRFEEEIRQVASSLGCAPTDALAELEKQSAAKPLGYWFGCMQGDGSGRPRFAVPDMLPEAVAKWLNAPYEPRTPEETAAVWSAVRTHPDIQALSPQIWSELEWLARWHEGWDIS